MYLFRRGDGRSTELGGRKEAELDLETRFPSNGQDAFFCLPSSPLNPRQHGPLFRTPPTITSYSNSTSQTSSTLSPSLLQPNSLEVEVRESQARGRVLKAPSPPSSEAVSEEEDEDEKDQMSLLYLDS